MKVNQGHAGDAVSFKAIGAGANGVASIIARAVRDDTGIARVVFLDLEDDLHQIGANVGDLGEDAAGNTQSRGAQAFANRETDEAWARIIARDEQQNEEHDEQLDEISNMPMLMPAFSGIAKHGYGLPRNPANAVREFANVLTRIPNHATP